VLTETKNRMNSNIPMRMALNMRSNGSNDGRHYTVRDHSTVIHSLERVAEMMRESAEFRSRVDKVRETVRHSP
jgi:hypothetical protein